MERTRDAYTVPGYMPLSPMGHVDRAAAKLQKLAVAADAAGVPAAAALAWRVCGAAPGEYFHIRAHHGLLTPTLRLPRAGTSMLLPISQVGGVWAAGGSTCTQVRENACAPPVAVPRPAGSPFLIHAPLPPCAAVCALPRARR